MYKFRTKTLWKRCISKNSKNADQTKTTCRLALVYKKQFIDTCLVYTVDQTIFFYIENDSLINNDLCLK